MTLICVNKIDKEMTLVELLETKLTNEEINKFIYNFKRFDIEQYSVKSVRKDFQKEELFSVITAAFAFHATKEGHKYWWDIATRSSEEGHDYWADIANR